MSGDPPEPSEHQDASLVATQPMRAPPAVAPSDVAPSDVLGELLEVVGASSLSTLDLGPPGGDGATGETWASAMSRLRIDDGGELARGGMGSVHRVNDPGIRRWVALKRVDAAHARSVPEVAHLLLEEAQITGQLEHPNIVPVYDLGFDADGHPMFTMKLVEGQTLSALIGALGRRAHRPDELRVILEVLVKTCDAVAFAHSRGVIHRDLKPDNIMVGEFGQVYVVDWGCAFVRTPAGAAPDRTVTIASPGKARTSPEAVLGTVAYMAPEQARGELAAVDERSDVYSLGAILYQVLTRQPPHRGKDSMASIRLAQAGVVVAPAQLRPHFDIPGELADIAMKALDPDPAQRYQSVAALRDAVRGFLARGAWFPQRRFAAGQDIVTEGAAADAAYIIVSGTCEASRQVQGTATVLRRMGPGDVFGETAILTDRPRSATVVAVTDVVATVITRTALEDELGGSPWLSAFARALASRLREAEQRGDAAASLGRKIALAVRVHVRAGGGSAAPWPPVRAALAATLGVPAATIDDEAGAAAELDLDLTAGVVRLR